MLAVSIFSAFNSSSSSPVVNWRREIHIGAYNTLDNNNDETSKTANFQVRF